MAHFDFKKDLIRLQKDNIWLEKSLDFELKLARFCTKICSIWLKIG